MIMFNQLSHFEPAGVAPHDERPHDERPHDERRRSLAEGKRGPGRVLRQRRKIGILLSNLGTPDGTDYWSMRRYLSEFLSDRRVIEVPRLIWFFVLNGVILTSRPARKGKDYQTIWNTGLDESPLKTITRSQANKLQASIAGGLLGHARAEVVVDWGMRYGNPSLKS